MTKRTVKKFPAERSVKLTVLHAAPQPAPEGKFLLYFKLNIRIFDGGLTGQGNSPTIEARVKAGSGEEAKEIALAVAQAVQSQVTKLGPVEALAIFETLIVESVTEEEARVDRK